MEFYSGATTYRVAASEGLLLRRSHTLDDFIEGMTGEECLGLLKWAKRHTPDLLRMLMASFLSGQGTVTDLEAHTDRCSSPGRLPGRPEAGSQETTTLREAEQGHIAQVISDSCTLREAAFRLGISHSTLWRKRKLYDLR
jgi:hypothetical protein